LALQDQILRIRLVQGLNTEPDDKLIPAGGLTRLENGIVTPVNTLEKRTGHDLLDNDDMATGNPITGSVALWSDGNTLYRHIGSNNVYAYGPDDSWRVFGSMITPTVTLDRLVRGPKERWNGDCVAANGLLFTIWEEQTGTTAVGIAKPIIIAVINESDGSVVLGPKQIATGGREPKAVLCNNIVQFYWIDGSAFDIKVKTVNSKDINSTWNDVASTVNSDISHRTGVGNAPGYDVVSYNGAALMAYQASSEDVKLAYISPAGIIVNTGSYGFTRPSPITASLGMLGCGPTLTVSPQGYIHVYGWCISGNVLLEQNEGIVWAGFRADTLTGRMAYEDAPDAMLKSAGYTVNRMSAGTKVKRETVSTLGTASLAISDCKSFCFWEYTTGSDSASTYPGAQNVRMFGTDYSKNAYSSAADVVRRAYLSGRPVGVEDSIYCAVTTSGTVQQNVIVVDHNGVPVIRATGLGSRIYSGSTPTWTTLSDGRMATVVPLRDQVPLSIASDGTVTSTGFAGRGLGILMVDFTATASLSSATRGGYTVIGGGQIHLLDGSSVTELGFHSYPEGTIATGRSSSLGGTTMSLDPLTGTGSYVYKPVYEWYDAYGRSHKSAGETFTVNLTGTQNSVYMLLPTLQTTMKGNTQNSSSINESIRVALYRTGRGGTAAGTIRQRVDSPRSPIILNATASWHGYTDTLDDVSLATREVDTSDVICPPYVPPAARNVSLVKGRFMLSGIADAKNDVWYSMIGTDNDGPAFTPLRTFTVENAGKNNVSAVSQLDSQGIVFTGNSILTFQGDGPSDAVTDNIEFTQPQELNSDVGCVDSRAIETITGESVSGLMFKSLKGWRLLDRGGSIRNIGAQVNEFNGLRTSGINHEPNSDKVRILNQDGPSLVYDTRWGQWSTMQDVRGNSSAVYLNKYVALRSDGYVLTPTTASNQYKDGNRPYTMLIETGWLTLQGLQDQGRLRNIMLIGTYKSPHTLRVEIAYNYRNDYSETHLINSSDALNIIGYGDDGYGDGNYGGGGDPVYQYRIRTKKQRCQSFRLRISDKLVDNTGGGSFSLSEIAIKIGVQPKEFDVPGKKTRS
jgi:hypothetical protein